MIRDDVPNQDLSNPPAFQITKEQADRILKQYHELIRKADVEHIDLITSMRDAINFVLRTSHARTE